MLRELFNTIVPQVAGRVGTGVPVVNVTANHEKMFAFIELGSVEDSDIVMCMDGYARVQPVAHSLGPHRALDRGARL